ncbi:MAG: TetR/AcrR family transcriptional regulator [Fibrobacter sp.]|nr:TetR/AcrR family transcriptional regulator [Fibrobacter sp.]
MANTLSSRQNDIVDAAIDIIGENGIQGLTIKRLAQEVGVTEPALYRHFDSKREIVIAVLRHFKDLFQTVFEDAVSTGKTGINLIEEVYRHHFEMFSRRPSIAAVLLSTEFFREEKQVSQQILNILDSMESAIIKAVGSVSTEEIRNDISSKDIALLVMGSMRLLVTRWWLSGLSFNIQKEGKALWLSLKKVISISG